MTLEEGLTQREKQKEIDYRKKMLSECPEFLNRSEIADALGMAKLRKIRINMVISAISESNSFCLKILEKELEILEWRIGSLLNKQFEHLSEERENLKQISFI